MTSNPKEPQGQAREFFLHEAFKDAGTANWTVRETEEKPPPPTGYPNDWVHVIEHSAYLDLERKLEQLKDDIYHDRVKPDDYRELVAANKTLREELAEAKAETEEMRKAGVREINRINFAHRETDLTWSEALTASELKRKALVEACANWKKQVDEHGGDYLPGNYKQIAIALKANEE